MTRWWKRIDADTAQTLLFRLFSVASGGVSILLFPYALGKAEQGFYYTILSLLALQVFFELGFNYVLTQIASHEFAKLETLPGHALQGPAESIERLSSLYKLVRRWYTVAGLLFLLVVLPSGLLFFRSASVDGTVSATVVVVWTCCVAAAAANLFLSPFLAILEGAGNVAAIANIRLRLSMCGYVVFWIALLAGAGLAAMPIPSVVLALGSMWWLTQKKSVLHHLRSRAASAGNQLNWRTDIFPFQWRISISWMGQYLMFQLFNPFIFMRQGAVEAGRIGMVMAIFTAVLNVGMSWVTAKSPTFGNLIALGERGKLNQLFKQVTRRSMSFTAAMCLLVCLGIWVLGLFFPAAALRVASPAVAVAVAIATLGNNFVFAAGTYMRAHKEDPLVTSTLVAGALILAGLYFGGYVSAALPMYIYAGVSMLVMSPWAYYLLTTYYRRSGPSPVGGALRGSR